MSDREKNQIRGGLKRKGDKATEISGLSGKRQNGYLKRALFTLVVFGCSGGTILAITNGYSARVGGLAEEIVLNAAELRDATQRPGYSRIEVDEILAELKQLITEYEAAMVFAESPYPGEIVLGSTPGGDTTWLEALCDSRYGGPLKEIRIRRTGHRAKYLRINDIEITYSTPAGWGKETFNENGRVKLYSGGVFKLALPRPMRIRRVRIRINHESTGLDIFGIPFDAGGIPHFSRRIHRPVVHHHGPSEVLLGTTPGGDDAWLETLCSNSFRRPIRQMLLKRTGSRSSYLRINDIEVTYLTPRGKRTEVFNKGGRVKLYPSGTFKLSLPRPMRVVKVRVLINHESNGLRVYGVY
jgi:hypothetical protein